MSFSFFMGLLCGNLLAAAALFLKVKLQRDIVMDERTAQVHARTGQITAYAAAAFAYAMWIYENIQANASGAPLHVVTPWTILLVVMLTVYLSTFLYQNWKMGEPIFGDPGDERAKRNGLVRLALALVFLPIAALAMEHSLPVGIFAMVLQVIMLILGAGTYMRSRSATK